MSGERPGFRGIPYAMEEELRGLPPAHRSVILSLAFLAAWEATTCDVDGVAVPLDRGEALVSARGHAKLLNLGPGSKGSSLFRRALDAGRRIGLLSTRPARPKVDAPPDARTGAPPDAPRDAPPTVVRFLRHREILWPNTKGDAPADAPPGAPADARADTIPQITASQITGEIPSPAARGRGRQAGASKPPDPRHAPLRDRLAATFAEVRGTPYGFAGGKDGKAIADLLRLSAGNAEEVIRRWRRALDLGAKWPGCSSLALLAARWNDLAAPAEPHLGVAPASRHVEGPVDVRAMLAAPGGRP
jgi:hypothetical protein